MPLNRAVCIHFFFSYQQRKQSEVSSFVLHFITEYMFVQFPDLIGNSKWLLNELSESNNFSKLKSSFNSVLNKLQEGWLVVHQAQDYVVFDSLPDSDKHHSHLFNSLFRIIAENLPAL